MAGAPGPVTRIWLTFVRVGSLNSTYCLQLGRHGKLRRNQIDLALDERRRQHLARQRQEDHVDPVTRTGLEALVEPRLHELAVLVRDAALHAPVDVVERAIVRHPDPHCSPLDELVEVACKRLQHGVAYRRRQLGFELERRKCDLALFDWLRLLRCRLIVSACSECHHGANEQNSSELDPCPHHCHLLHVRRLLARPARPWAA